MFAQGLTPWVFGREVPKGSRELLFCIGLGYHVFSVNKLHPFHMFHHEKHPDLFVVLWLEDYNAARAFNIHENIQEAVWCSGNALNWRGRELAPGFSFFPRLLCRPEEDTRPLGFPKACVV